MPYDPAILLPGIYLEKTLIRKDTWAPIFIAALFTIAKTWKQPKCPSTDEWIKMWYTEDLRRRGKAAHRKEGLWSVEFRSFEPCG